MTHNTTNYAFPYPDETDSPDGATQIQNLAVAVDSQMHTNAVNAATASGRTALLSTLLGGGAAHSTQTSGTATTTATTNGAMTISTVVVGHSFVAPPSGIVQLFFGGGLHHSLASGSTIFVGAAVATGSTVGSGTIVSDSVDIESIQVDGTNNTPGYKSRFATGLTPGTTYNVFLKWRESGGGTATVANPFVESTPALQ